MIYNADIRKIGNSYGVILSKEILAKLNAEEGDTLFMTESPGQSINITLHDPKIQEQMEIAEVGMKKYKETLKALADM